MVTAGYVILLAVLVAGTVWGLWRLEHFKDHDRH